MTKSLVGGRDSSREPSKPVGILTEDCSTNVPSVLTEPYMSIPFYSEPKPPMYAVTVANSSRLQGRSELSKNAQLQAGSTSKLARFTSRRSKGWVLRHDRDASAQGNLNLKNVQLTCSTVPPSILTIGPSSSIQFAHMDLKTGNRNV